MKKTLSLALIAISIFFLACNKENAAEKINEIEEVESSGKVAEEVELEQVKPEIKIEDKTSVIDEKEEVVVTPVATPVITVKSFSMTAQKWSFSPSTITVNKGDTVKIAIKSTDVAHGFFLSEFGVSETLTPGKTTNVSFVADKSGTFSFTCSVYCGSGHSDMVGTLIVK